jgi:hypothetical protein
MSNTTIKNTNNDQGGRLYDLTLKKLTTGELMALTRALMFYDSAVGNDVLSYIRNAIQQLHNPYLTEDIESSLKQLSEKMQDFSVAFVQKKP